MSILVFDIETVPDVKTGRKLLDIDEQLEDKDVVKAMQHLRFQQSGTEFMPVHLHQIVAISVVYEQADQLKVWSLGDEKSAEKELVQRFFDGIEKMSPTLVSWNGAGFDLPVLSYRALLHKVQAPRFWEMGEHDKSFRYDNYLNRYHWRHIDLMDVMGHFQPRAFVKLDECASMLGFPGKIGMTGANVWDQYLANDIKSIRNYCETDVLNTYLVYLRFQLMRAEMDEVQYEKKCEALREMMYAQDKAHFEEFVQAWDEAEEINAA